MPEERALCNFLSHERRGQGLRCPGTSRQNSDAEPAQMSGGNETLLCQSMRPPPTVALESVLITANIEEFEGRYVVIINVPGAFLSAKMGEEVIMNIRGRLAELMVQEAPNIYRKYITIGANNDKLLPLPQPPVRARTDARTNPSAQRATQLRSVLACVYAVSLQNQITTTVP
jgi:hypothetical protein